MQHEAPFLRGCVSTPVPLWKGGRRGARAAHLDEEGLAVAVAPGEHGVDGGRDAPAVADPPRVGGRRGPAVQQPVVVPCCAGGAAVRGRGSGGDSAGGEGPPALPPSAEAGTRFAPRGQR